jgi:hypothetical protein
MFMQFIEGGIYMACLWPTTFSPKKESNPKRGLLNPETLEPRPTYHALSLFSNCLGHELIESKSSSKRIPCISTLSRDRSSGWIYLINKFGDPKNVCLSIVGYKIKSADATAMVAAKEEVKNDEAEIKDLYIKYKNNNAYFTIPPYSLIMLTINFY